MTEKPFSEIKTGPMHVAQVDLERGTFVSYPSIFGRIDEYQDKVWPGAYTKTIQERGPEGTDIIRCCWQHRWDEPLGRPLVLEEHSRDRLPPEILKLYPDAQGGLFAKTKLTLEVQKASEALALMRDDTVKRMSIGYDAMKYDFEQIKEVDIRNLREIKLWDYSPVTFAAEEAAMITGVKAVVAYQNLALASEDRAWDKAAAESRVRSWAGGGESLEDIDWPKYRKAFVWYDAENTEQVGGYKLMIADIIDGSLKAVPRGIFAAAVVVMGGRGGVNIPESDIPKVKNHLARYYRKMDREPPWEREASSLIVDLERWLSLSAELKTERLPTNEQTIKSLISDLEGLLTAAEPAQGPLTADQVRSRERRLALHQRRLEELRWN